MFSSSSSEKISQERSGIGYEIMNGFGEVFALKLMDNMDSCVSRGVRKYTFDYTKSLVDVVLRHNCLDSSTGHGTYLDVYDLRNTWRGNHYYTFKGDASAQDFKERLMVVFDEELHKHGEEYGVEVMSMGSFVYHVKF